jgi:thioredoxin reductase
MGDVIVVGGSYAGLSAALQIARARRHVSVIDADARRNRFALHSHGYLGFDGDKGAAIVKKARAELLAYPTVTWIEGTATMARATPDGFAIDLASGALHEARHIVLAVGVVDELPDLPGIAARWGRSVFNCPYCHAYEMAGGHIAVLATSAFSVHTALLLPDWGKVTYFTRGLFEPSEENVVALGRRGVSIERAPVVAIEGTEREVQVRLEGGRALSFRGVHVGSKTRVASPLAEQLGCAFNEGPLGTFVRVDATTETTVPGVFACGDMAMPAGSVALAVGDGARAGVSAHQSLVFRRHVSTAIRSTK